MIHDIVKRIKEPRDRQLPTADVSDSPHAQRSVGDDGSTPPEFVAIEPADFEVDKAAWGREHEAASRRLWTQPISETASGRPSAC